MVGRTGRGESICSSSGKKSTGMCAREEEKIATSRGGFEVGRVLNGFKHTHTHEYRFKNASAALPRALLHRTGSRYARLCSCKAEQYEHNKRVSRSSRSFSRFTGALYVPRANAYRERRTKGRYFPTIFGRRNGLTMTRVSVRVCVYIVVDIHFGKSDKRRRYYARAGDRDAGTAE